MSAEEVDEYLHALEEPQRSTLEALRRTILEVLPDAQEAISYRVPDRPLPKALVKRLIAVRLGEVNRRPRLP